MLMTFALQFRVSEVRAVQAVGDRLCAHVSA
jgi:hypothetical protein